MPFHCTSYERTISRLALAGLLPIILSGCYDYHSVSEGPSTFSPTRNASPSSPAANQGNPQGPSKAEAETETKANQAIKHCTERFPETPGHKTDQVRCIVSSTDAIWDQAFPQGSEERHALGAYAVQLAEREDRGEITREQAENLYMQFLQQTPGMMGLPPQPPH
jgi:hypothetical protein